MKCCPTCNRPYPPKIQVGGLRRQAIVDFISRRPEGATYEQIINHVYADDPNGGPDCRHGVAVMVYIANEKLKNSNSEFRIRATGGPGGVYRIVHESARGLHLSPEQRLEVARDRRLAGEIAQAYGISRQTVYNLRKKYGRCST